MTVGDSKTRLNVTIDQKAGRGSAQWFAEGTAVGEIDFDAAASRRTTLDVVKDRD